MDHKSVHAPRLSEFTEVPQIESNTAARRNQATSQKQRMDADIVDICRKIGFLSFDRDSFVDWVEFQHEHGEGMESVEIVYTYFLKEFSGFGADLEFDELCGKAGIHINFVQEFLAPVPELTWCTSKRNLLWMYIVNQCPDQQKPHRPCPFQEGTVDVQSLSIQMWNPKKETGEELKMAYKDPKIRMVNFLAKLLEAYDNEAVEGNEPDTKSPLWYHGTDSFSAGIICEDKIQLSFGRLPASFGVVPSFYVTKSKRAALRSAWIKMLFDHRSTSASGAVIIFEASQEELEEKFAPYLFLSHLDPEEDWEQNMQEKNVTKGDYHAVVSRSRKAPSQTCDAVRAGREDPIIPRRINWVQGLNHRRLIKNSDPPRWDVVEDETIMGIRSQHMADYFDQQKRGILLSNNDFIE